MKKKVIKTACVAVCVVAVGMSSFKAYNAAKLSEGDQLLAENVEALSRPEASRYGEGGTPSTGDWCVMANCNTGAYTCKVQIPSGEVSCVTTERIDPGDQGPGPEDDDE